MKTINIFINNSKKEEINKMKVKYQLSLTTIVDILVYETLKLFKNTKQEELTDYFTKSYIHNQGSKTSIKEPKILKMLNMENKQKVRLITNIFECYLRKDLKEYVKDQNALNKYYSSCDRKMTDTYEENWNYNNFIRMQRRMLRTNKEYFRKALEQV